MLPSIFLQDLVDVPVEHGDRAEALETGKRLRAVLGAPAPLGVDRSTAERGRRRRRRAAAEACDVLLAARRVARCPATPRAACRWQVGDVDQADEVDALVVEAVPAGARGCPCRSGSR